MLLCFPAAAPHRSKCWVATRCQRVWRWKKKCFPALKKFANWKKLLTAGFSWAILEQEIRKKPLACLAFVSCCVCPAGRNVEIMYGGHGWKNNFRAQRVFDWKRMFTAESFGAILEQEIRQNFNILSCRSWPFRIPIRRSNCWIATCRQTWKWKKKIVFRPKKFENWQKMLAARSPWATLEQDIRKKLFCFVSCRVTAPRKKGFRAQTSLRIGRKRSPLDLLGKFWF